MARFSGTLVAPTDTMAAKAPRFKGTPAAAVVDPNSDTPPDVAGSRAYADWAAARARAGKPIPQVSEPPPEFKSGVFNNVMAGLNDVIYRTLGLPVDFVTGAYNAALDPHDLSPIPSPLTVAGNVAKMLGAKPIDPDKAFGGHKSIAELFAKIGTPDPDTVTATNGGERLARAAGEGVGYALAPETEMGLLSKIPGLTKTVEATRPFVAPASDTGGAVVKNVLANAAASTAAQGAADVVPEPFKPLASTLGAIVGGGGSATLMEAPALYSAGKRLAGEYIEPFSDAGRQQIAGRRLTDMATDPAAVKDALAAHDPALDLPGYAPTTAQVAPDLGLAAAERAAATKNPVPFVQRRADQNASRLNAMTSIQAPGAPETVTKAIRSHLADIDNDGAVEAQAAVTRARDEAGRQGVGAPPEDVGHQTGRYLEGARANTKTNERALWQAVDPDKTMRLDITDTRQRVKNIEKAVTPMADPISDTEAAIYDSVKKVKDPVVPLDHLSDLQSRLKKAMRAEKSVYGESPAYRRMSQLNSSVESDLDRAISGEVRQQQQQVSAGTRDAEDTIFNRVKQWQDAWYNDKAGAVGATGDGRNAGIGPATVSGGGGTARAPGIGSGDDAGFEGLSAAAGREPSSPEEAAAALDRLRVARAATKARVETFDNDTLGPLISRPSRTSPYDLPRGAVPGRVFFPGPKSPEAIHRLRAAIGDEPALNMLTQYATDRLRKAALREDGTLDPTRTLSWVRNHADALRALPGFDQRVIPAVRSTAAADTAVRDTAARSAAERHGVIGQLENLTDPADVQKVVASVFNRADSMAQINAIKRAIRNDPEAEAGLKKAVANHIVERFVGNREAGASGLGSIKADQFQTFIVKHEKALRAAGFDEPQLTTMRRIATSLRDADRSLNGVRLPTGSNTTQDVLASKVLDAPGTILTKIIAAGALSGASGAGALIGGLPGAAIGAGGAIVAGLTNTLRQQGLTRVDQLVERALLDPDFAAMLLKKVKLSNTRRAVKQLGQRAARSTITGVATTDNDPLGIR